MNSSPSPGTCICTCLRRWTKRPPISSLAWSSGVGSGTPGSELRSRIEVGLQKNRYVCKSVATTGGKSADQRVTGCGAAWLARLTGGQEVAGSNPASPTIKQQVRAYKGRRQRGSVSTAGHGLVTGHEQPGDKLGRLSVESRHGRRVGVERDPARGVPEPIRDNLDGHAGEERRGRP